jgi:phospholipid/cholesterol/gamma-HCH transport system substrate-binding protein
LQQFNKSLMRGDEILSDIQRATGPLGERAPRVLQNLETGSDQFNRAILDLREIMREVSRADGTLQRFLSDPGLYNNLAGTTEAVYKMMPRIDRVLRDLEVFADKIARHPESLGVGGAVRPSAGLKEGAPSSNSRVHAP